MGIMVIMNDLEWPMISYYMIYYEKFNKIMQWIEKAALSIVLGSDSYNVFDKSQLCVTMSFESETVYFISDIIEV